MSDVRAIVQAFDEAVARGERCALATVVSVEGSSYRQPGARMLVCEAGTTVGSISASCLERDVIEHARLLMRTGVPRMLEYDTGDEVAWGLGLGCRGVVRLLLEPMFSASRYVQVLRRCADLGRHDAPTVVATVYHHQREPGAAMPEIELGARLFIEADGNVSHERMGHEEASALEREVRAACREGLTAGSRTHRISGVMVTTFIETLVPPVPLVIFGAGHDVLPVLAFAHALGWHTEVVDLRARPATPARFANADRVTLARPEDVHERVDISPRTMTLLMSHDYAHDLAALRFVLASPSGYIGVMGPRARTEQMLQELGWDAETVTSEDRRVHSPVGLDIGASGPADIALSVVAEIAAALNRRPGGMLRERRGSVHQPALTAPGGGPGPKADAAMVGDAA
jgi:xanthine dehydrogenase accessory factor